ncbi:uncharacterized protein UV8b_08241 [Ustilaginoidea virens]|uniref:Extracellular serine-rich protein n=1 Tax=Ustilaginoidea virens TaxID=1159556 RepID=A0A8E5HZ06_USTVR|nr:uncharacterized protein UV8b_08241 [Ustilaginoidea virens]QUC24000.1 hypothetical protein UV8b_08241 [Ustilaginoidea virens]
MKKPASAVLAGLLGLAQAIQVHVVAVGKNPGSIDTGLRFFPERIRAEPGSLVQFQFRAGNHTVTQSDFDNPCVPVSSIDPSVAGVFSSFQPVAGAAGAVPVFTVLVNDTRPIWLFCSQGAHCQKGMAMVINENAAANATRSLETYKRLAQKAPTGQGVPSRCGDGSAGPAASSGYLPTTAAGGNGGGGGGGALVTPAAGGTNDTADGLPPAATTPPPPAVSSPALVVSGAAHVAVPGAMLLVLGGAFMFL